MKKAQIDPDLKALISITKAPKKTRVFTYVFAIAFVATTAFLAFNPSSKTTSPWFNNQLYRAQVSSLLSHFFPNSTSPTKDSNLANVDQREIGVLVGLKQDSNFTVKADVLGKSQPSGDGNDKKADALKKLPSSSSGNGEKADTLGKSPSSSSGNGEKADTLGKSPSSSSGNGEKADILGKSPSSSSGNSSNNSDGKKSDSSGVPASSSSSTPQASSSNGSDKKSDDSAKSSPSSSGSDKKSVSASNGKEADSSAKSSPSSSGNDKKSDSSAQSSPSSNGNDKKSDSPSQSSPSSNGNDKKTDSSANSSPSSSGNEKKTDSSANSPSPSSNGNEKKADSSANSSSPSSNGNDKKSDSPAQSSPSSNGNEKKTVSSSNSSSPSSNGNDKKSDSSAKSSPSSNGNDKKADSSTKSSPSSNGNDKKADSAATTTTSSNDNAKKTDTSSSSSASSGDGNKWIKDMVGCDIFQGHWVKDDSYPLYAEGSCPHIDEPFNCYLNGRPDRTYQKLRWKPDGCNIPRLNATDMLERLRGKRLVFVGDSLNRNMWESLVCVLKNSVKDKSRVFEASGKHEFRTDGSYSFLFKDYGASVEFFRSPFLVQEWEMHNGSKTKETLRLDTIAYSASKYKDAHVIIFNTGHWWTHEKTSKGKDYYQEGNKVYSELNVVDAFHKALNTWAKWVDTNVNPKKSLVFFRGYSASHFSGGQWNSGGACDRETEPIKNETYLSSYPPKMNVLETVIKSMKTPVSYLNITRMTDYRKDAHPSVFRKQNLTEEERKDPERFQDCSHWCLPGVPDSWNELLYAQLIIKQYQM